MRCRAFRVWDQLRHPVDWLCGVWGEWVQNEVRKTHQVGMRGTLIGYK